MKNRLYSFQPPPPLHFWLQNSWLTFPQSSSSNRTQKELFFLPRGVCPKSITIMYIWPGVSPFWPKDAVSLKEGLLQLSISGVGNEGEKERGRGYCWCCWLCFFLTLFLPLPFQPGMPLWQQRVSIQSAAAPQCFHSPANSFRLCFLQT